MSQVTFLGFVDEFGVVEVLYTEYDDVTLAERAAKALKKFAEKAGVYEVIIKDRKVGAEVVDLDNPGESWEVNIL